jgi:hypothetical protein
VNFRYAGLALAVNVLGWFLVSSPNLNGTWHGESVRSYDKKTRKTTLAIRQNILHSDLVAFGSDNEAECY